MIKKTPLTPKHLEILGLYHSFKNTGFGKTKVERINEIQKRLKIYTKSSIKNIIDRYYDLFLETLEELKKVSENLTKEDLTKIYNLENLSEKQINFIFYCLQGIKPVEAAEKAGYKYPSSTASRLIKKKKIQTIFEEQRKTYLELNKFGLCSVLGILENTIEQANQGYDVVKTIERKSVVDGEETSFKETKTEKIKNLGVVVSAISVWADIMGAKAVDKIRADTVDLKAAEIALKKKQLKNELTNIPVFITGGDQLED